MCAFNGPGTVLVNTGMGAADAANLSNSIPAGSLGNGLRGEVGENDSGGVVWGWTRTLITHLTFRARGRVLGMGGVG
jgi:hypothetical protein